MTYQTLHFSAVDNVINAGRNEQQRADGSLGNCLGSGRYNSKVAPGMARSCSISLLSNILSRVASEKKSCIQFMACGEGSATKSIALATSTIAAQLGLSLLLDASVGKRVRRSDTDNSGEPLPDAFVSKLYHFTLEENTLSLVREGRWLFSNIISPFKFIVVDSGEAANNATGMALAPLCSGTVLVVRAAASRYSSVKQAQMQIVSSGGTLIGSVLEDAPEKLPRWARGA